MLQATRKSKEEFGKHQRGDLWDLPIYKSKGKRQRADQVVEIGDKNITHLTTAKRASAAKSLKLTDSLTSSTTAEHFATTCTSYSRPTVFLEILWHGHRHSTRVLNS